MILLLAASLVGCSATREDHGRAPARLELTLEECRALGQDLAQSLDGFLSRKSAAGVPGGVSAIVHVDDSQLSSRQQAIVHVVLDYLNRFGTSDIPVRMGADDEQVGLELRIEIIQVDSATGRTANSGFMVHLTLRDMTTGVIEFSDSANVYKEFARGIIGG